ncbi:seipin co-factor family protein [Aspergillus ibericus CBS 121593]|uniref:Uncharacterized protein n=1 Tax=Aspergillus ibericus CBS 121593 TaxID=1448316 RepID=A0A395H2J4_9EURO|nr:hypothetical protein BO80DRAFT_433837 [Aspergillus ibericus CBS 121593]RAL02107.1 hypothetical protein BO80DRAFT_433837 [Aspergillus ibericus CBS 121593]
MLSNTNTDIDTDPMIPSQFPSTVPPMTPTPRPPATIKSELQSSILYTHPLKAPHQRPPTIATTPPVRDNSHSGSTSTSRTSSSTTTTASSHSSALSHPSEPPTGLHSLGSKISATVAAHPVLATFVLAQVLFSGIPVCLFVGGVVASAALAAGVFTCFALLVLGPVVVVTTLVAVGVWGSGWVVYKVGGWAVRRVLVAEVNDEVEGIAEGGRMGMWHGDGGVGR